MTHNAISGLRLSLVEEAVASLRAVFPDSGVVVLDNGSTDGTDVWVGEQEGGVVYVPEDGNHTPGRGRNVLIDLLRKDRPDVVVLSDDDMVWKEGAAELIAELWSNAPDDVVIVGGLLEPVWHWNTPRETLDFGVVRGLIRDSVPGAAWTVRAAHLDKVFPVKDDFGYDYATCCSLRGHDLRVASLDLADHAGWGYSTHGNDPRWTAKPLDREKWGV